MSSGECEPIAGKTMPSVTVVERDYPNLYKRFTALGPLMAKLGNGGKCMAWNTEHEVDFLKRLNGVVTEDGPTKGLPKIESDIDAAEVILTLAPETNGEVAVKAWESLGKTTGRAHTHLAIPKADEKIRFPIDTRSVKPVIEAKPNGEKQIVLNFITPHQKWGIHSTYTDNLLMLTLSRGGPIVWISEKDAAQAGIVDNDWIEAYNSNGALVARAVVSQRVKQGMCLMYHAQEKIVNVPGSEMTGQRGRHSQFRHARGGQADPYDRRLRPAVLRLQLLRYHRHEPRRVRDRAQAGQGRLARPSDR
jgi:nitrate reductase alpha subunit